MGNSVEMSTWAWFIKLSSNVYYLVSYQRIYFGLL